MDLLRDLSRRVRQVARKAVLNAISDGSGLQVLQVKLGAAPRAGIERFQEYGFSSVPQVGAEAIVLGLGGNSDHCIAIAVDDRRYRIKSLQPGEVAIYSDQGDQIVIKRNGNIHVVASTSVAIDSPSVTMTGNLAVDGDVTAGGISLKTHKHTGVMSGGALTGTPV